MQKSENKTVYAEDASSINPSTSFSVARLNAGELLFAPRGYLTTWQFLEDSYLISYCYVDASNFNHFKHALALESHIIPLSREVLSALNDRDFDTSMERNAKESPWSSYLQWPRDLNRSTEGEAAMLGGRKRGRSTGGFKDWQVANKWNYMILGLTLPAPAEPKVIAVGRTNATLLWNTGFHKPKNDASALRYLFLPRAQFLIFMKTILCGRCTFSR